MSKTFASKGFIDQKLYEKIVEVMPVSCVDLIIVHKDSFLLGKRINSPAKGKWWVPGGRILKGESLEHAARRKCIEETGLKIKTMKNLLTKEWIFPQESSSKTDNHVICTVFKIEVNSVVSLKKDSQHEEVRWFQTINPSWSKYLRDILEKAGFLYA